MAIVIHSGGSRIEGVTWRQMSRSRAAASPPGADGKWSVNLLSRKTGPRMRHHSGMCLMVSMKRSGDVESLHDFIFADGTDITALELSCGAAGYQARTLCYTPGQHPCRAKTRCLSDNVTCTLWRRSSYSDMWGTRRPPLPAVNGAPYAWGVWWTWSIFSHLATLQRRFCSLKHDDFVSYSCFMLYVSLFQWSFFLLWKLSPFHYHITSTTTQQHLSIYKNVLPKRLLLDENNSNTTRGKHAICILPLYLCCVFSFSNNLYPLYTGTCGTYCTCILSRIWCLRGQ
jgi:hypothetical protein